MAPEFYREYLDTKSQKKLVRQSDVFFLHPALIIESAFKSCEISYSHVNLKYVS